MRAWTENPTVRRLVACLFGGFVLALMVGNQEGSQNDFGLAFHEATRAPRLIGFLAIGLAVFAFLTFRPLITPYIRQPGAVAIGVGFGLVFAGMALLQWYEPVGKFGPVATAVGKSAGAPFLVSVYFSWFAWALLVLCLVLGGVAVATRIPLFGYLEFGLGIVAAVLVFVAHHQLVSFAGGIDHSLGTYLAVIGYASYAIGGLIAARSQAQTADPKAAVELALAWRPGLPLVGVALVLGLSSFLNAAWFAPLQLNADFTKTGSDFHGEGLPNFAVAYLGWLGTTLFAVGIVVAAAGCLLRSRILGWAAIVLGLVGMVLTFFTLDKITTVGAHAVSAYGKTWQNLGAGGWLACLAFCLIAGAGALTTTGATARMAAAGAAPGDAPRAVKRRASGSAVTRTIVVAAVAMALFYPPTLPLNWQSLIVTQIAVYLVLAVGLNVVVGWAGLLDLGYIAFYGIGSYTVAYFTGSLPLKPPDFLHFSPLLAVPFAILVCVIAGVLLGFPTLRLRGDYLAIVTLGFGEIIQLAAINNPGNLTGGPVGPDVPHPVIHVGPIHVTFGLDNLPYWYLLLALLGLVVLLFYRLEGSRLGRAWAAIREDEVAAQATGIHTARAKLLAFAIGASTSGIAGVFFATQVGYFDPSQFTLQNSILIVAYVVFGGMGSLVGVIAGAAVLTWLPYFLQSQVPLPDSQMWIGALIIIMMIFRPAGLIPARRRRAELTGLDAPLTSETSAVPASEGISSPSDLGPFR
jgi:ABC-type branched-subunit amino acid transport system permease subunit